MDIGQQLINTAISRFKFTPEQLTMASFNEYQHLESQGEAQMVTYR
jgi:hypothetical protein